MEEIIESVVEDVSVDAEQVETEQNVESSETVETTAVDAPKTDNNGEAIRREVERREAKLKQQYESQMEEIRKENAYLDKQAQIYGYRDRNEYKKALDAHLADQEVEKQAQIMGVDAETYKQFFQPVNQEVDQLRQEVQTYREQFTAQQQKEQQTQSWGELYSAHPDLVESSAAFNEGKNPDWYSPQMQELVSMGYKPVHAYELANKDTLFKKKEQEVLARLTGRDSKQVLSSVDSPNPMTLNPADMTNAEIQSISERVRRGERITF
jgi:hypothetical protein